MSFSCQLEYTEPISEELYPFYLQLYDAVKLFLEGSAKCKDEYMQLVEQAMFELNYEKDELKKERLKL